MLLCLLRNYVIMTIKELCYTLGIKDELIEHLSTFYNSQNISTDNSMYGMKSAIIIVVNNGKGCIRHHSKKDGKG